MDIKIQSDIREEDLLFINVPEAYTLFRIVNYGYAGTYIMEMNTTGLNHWKMKIGIGTYEPLGFVKDVVVGEIKTDKNFVLRIL